MSLHITKLMRGEKQDRPDLGYHGGDGYGQVPTGAVDRTALYPQRSNKPSDCNDTASSTWLSIVVVVLDDISELGYYRSKATADRDSLLISRRPPHEYDLKY